jgi:hypothetical protein
VALHARSRSRPCGATRPLSMRGKRDCGACFFARVHPAGGPRPSGVPKDDT